MKFKIIVITLLLLTTFLANAQTKNYKEYRVCISWDVYKGKKNHGQKHCTGLATVRKYNDGRIDTVGWSFAGKIQWGDEIGKYDKLSERGKYIVDSLKEDGITQFHDAYLTYEPIYMKPGKKIERLWRIEGESVVIYEYLFWNNAKGNGIRLLKEFTP